MICVNELWLQNSANSIQTKENDFEFQVIFNKICLDFLLKIINRHNKPLIIYQEK